MPAVAFFVFINKQTVLVAYMPKKKKKICSSMCDDYMSDWDTNERLKPEIISFYNMTKDCVGKYTFASLLCNVVFTFFLIYFE